MGNKVVKFIMAGQLMFFLFMGMQVVSHEIDCARNDGITSVLVSMPMRNLSEVNI